MMNKDDYQIALETAQNNLNNIVKAARQDNHTVDLTIVTDGPGSTVSLVSVIIK